MQIENLSFDSEAKVKFSNNPSFIANKLKKRKRISSIDEFTFRSVAIGSIFDQPNFIRFSYYCLIYGGINFIVAYCSIVLIIGIPLLFIEVLLGQYCRVGDSKAWSFVRSLNGISYSHLIINIFLTFKSFIVSTRIIIILHSIIFYIPDWSHCMNKWNSKNCMPLTTESFDISNTNISNIQFLLQKVLFVDKHIVNLNYTYELVTFEHSIFEIFFPIVIVFMLFLLVEIFKKSYIFYVSILSISSVVIVSLILMVIGVTLQHAGEGLKTLVIPNKSAIFDSEVWLEIVNEILVTYKLGTGNLIILASCNKYNSDIKRNVVYLALLEVIMSLIGSIATAEFIGSLITTDLTDNFMKYDNILFIILSKEFNVLEYPNLLIFVVYSMLLVKQINIQLVNAEVIQVILIQKFTYFRKSNTYKIIFRILMYLTALIILLAVNFVTDLFLWYKIIINYCLYKAIPIIIFIQVISIVYIYGLTNMNHFYFVLRNYHISYWIKCSLILICPTMIVFAIAHKINVTIDYNEFVDDVQTLSITGRVVGWYIFGICLLPIPLYFVVETISMMRKNRNVNIVECIRLSLQNNASFDNLLSSTISKDF